MGKARTVLDEAKPKERERWDSLHGVITTINTMPRQKCWPVIVSYGVLRKVSDGKDGPLYLSDLPLDGSPYQGAYGHVFYGVQSSSFSWPSPVG